MNIAVSCKSLGYQWFAFQAPFKIHVNSTVGIIIILLKSWNKHCEYKNGIFFGYEWIKCDIK